MLQDLSSIRKPWDLKGAHAISNISIRKQIKILYLSLPLLALLVPLPCFWREVTLQFQIMLQMGSFLVPLVEKPENALWLFQTG